MFSATVTLQSTIYKVVESMFLRKPISTFQMTLSILELHFVMGLDAALVCYWDLKLESANRWLFED